MSAPIKNKDMLVIGYGNRERADDAAGPVASDQLRTLGIPAKVCTGDALALLELWRGAPQVILIDAVVPGARAGTIHRWDTADQFLSSQTRFASTHALGLMEAIALAKSLGCLPAQMQIYGIEGQSFQIGHEMSPEVKDATKNVVRQIVNEGKRNIRLPR